jgi:hypothetical protein
MATFDDFIETADELIRENGAAVTLTRPGAGAYDPLLEIEGTADTTATVRAVGLPPGRSAAFVLGSLIGRKILQFYIAQKDQTLVAKQGDLITWVGGVIYKILWTTTYDPAGDGAIMTIAYGEA